MNIFSSKLDDFHRNPLMYNGPEAKKDKSLEKWRTLRELDPYDYANKM